MNHYLFGALERFAREPMLVQGDRAWTYGEAARAIHGVARRLGELGVVAGDRVAIIAENSPRWFFAYAAILARGAVAVPRGVDIAPDELTYILEHSGSRVAFAASDAVSARFPAGVTAIAMDGDDFPGAADIDAAALRGYREAAAPDDLAVLLYTSGTTGQPKGVMLEHRNVAHNIRVLPEMVGMSLGDVWVSVLPSWHTFEQTVELCGFSVGCVTVYSSKRSLRDDLRRHRPHFFASVPRIWETIHSAARAAIANRGPLVRALFRAAFAGTRMHLRGNPLGRPLHALGRALFYGKIRAATGGRLKAAVSGGGALPHHVDEFFNGAGIRLLVGYGLTETAPVVALRLPERNVLGTIGRAVPETEIRVGPHGTFCVRGPQVMRGYYRDEETTTAVMDDAGWFDTGDLGRITDAGDLVFVGRRKETIVLSGGENVEPEPIENSILLSPLIGQVMLVGQDRKALGALVVPDPDSGAGEAEVRAALRARTGPAAGFRTFEAVHRFALLDEPFSPENGLLTATLKMRRNVIAQHFADRIHSLYS